MKKLEEPTSQAVEVHKLLIFSNDKYWNRLLAIDKAHVLCKTKIIRKIKRQGWIMKHLRNPWAVPGLQFRWDWEQCSSSSLDSSHTPSRGKQKIF
jgi:hypothetical protein